MPFKSRYNADFTGKVSYGHKVVVSIISLAAMEIRGVARLQGKGIRTETIGDTINIDVYIDVMIGFSCAEVAYRVQENIKRSVESMTVFKTGAINVNVLGVCFEETK
jgi:alkaline shock protein